MKEYTVLRDKEWLYKKYWAERLSICGIAKLVGCSRGAVWGAFKRFNIETRSLSEAHKGKRLSEGVKKRMSEAIKGEKNPMYGKHHTEETKQKIRESQKGLQAGENNPFYGKRHTEETRRKISRTITGRHLSEEHKRKLSEMYKGAGNPNYGKHHSEESKRKMRAARKHINNPRYNTKPELIFEEICQKYLLPFKYTGDGSFWIKDINPDFVEVNGKKIAIEIFGDYWHSPLLRRNVPYIRTYEGRRKTLKKYGWKLIVLWESDLKREDAEDFVLSVLREGGVIE